jgi:hypothetical protein
MYTPDSLRADMRRYEAGQVAADLSADEVTETANDLMREWKARAAALIATPDDGKTFALTEEVFDDSPTSFEEIGISFALATLANDQKKILALQMMIVAHAAGKADKLAEARQENSTKFM